MRQKTIDQPPDPVGDPQRRLARRLPGGAQLTARARAVGVADLLRKPVVRRDIAEALARALGARRPHLSSSAPLREDDRLS